MRFKQLLLLVLSIAAAGVIAIVVFLVPVRSEVYVSQSNQEEDKMQTGTQSPTSATTSRVTFSAADGLIVTADLYSSTKTDAPFIILFHQARYSRGEYLEIAPKLVSLGYNCLAVDQRSGSAVNGIINETNKAAQEKNLPTAYPDAYADLEAALSYVIATFAPKQLIVWGSSYSSSLSLILAAEHPKEISAVLAFSPGEYFQFNGKQIADYAKNIQMPAFITSAKSEAKDWSNIAAQIKSSGSSSFLPEGAGKHGSSALMEQTPNHAEYWTAVEGFLSSLNKK